VATTKFELAGIPGEFFLFAITLLGIAIFHNRTLLVALSGLAAITTYKLALTDFAGTPGIAGLTVHLRHEWVTLANLLCLLVGFAVLSRHFEESRVPDLLPRMLPDDWKGAFLLLVLIFAMSGFLDNIAAAIIGATVAGSVFRHRVHIGYLAAIVAAANAGGAGSVLGDTTTTMMWLEGVSPLTVLPAYLAACVALIVFGVPAAFQQHRFAPITKDASERVTLDSARIGIVALMLLAAMMANIVINLRFKHVADAFPFIGVAVWLVILATIPLRRPDWSIIPNALKGAIFLLALVLCASMMPVDKLPLPSSITVLGLGVISAVFDNIPLTALALKQGGYDWALLAYAVGFGGSMVWFGSSAGVAVSNIYPEAKSVWTWVKHSWHIPLAYIVGFAVMFAVLGWNP